MKVRSKLNSKQRKFAQKNFKQKMCTKIVDEVDPKKNHLRLKKWRKIALYSDHFSKL
jgi:hypothetical protein